MPNGKPGDHPLTDLLVHGLEVYGKEVDDLILEISQLLSRRELDDWWEKEIGWGSEPDRLAREAEKKLSQLKVRTKN